MPSYSAWVEEKIAVASAVANGCCGGGYDEGAIILCAVISAMSALAWPGKGGIDKKRFVEAVIKFHPANLDPTLISVPLLAEALSGCELRLQVPRKSFHLLGSGQDRTEIEILSAFPQLRDKMKLREYSYVHLLYEQVRCGFAHNYKIGDKASNSDQVRDIFRVGSAEVSYPSDGKRRVYFSLEWISDLAKSVGRGLDCECANRIKPIFDDLNLPEPSQWWIDG
jgi:hypothetical protein